MNRLLNNWPLKLTALLLSVGLWSHVRGESNPLETATFSVRLDASAPATLRLESSDAPRAVKVTVRAPHQTLRQLSGVTLPLPNPLDTDNAEVLPVQNNGLTATLDFSGVSATASGAQTVPVRVDAVESDVEVLGVKPASASVVLGKP